MSLVKISLLVLEASLTQTRGGSRTPIRLKSEKDVPLSHSEPGQSVNMWERHPQKPVPCNRAGAAMLEQFYTAARPQGSPVGL